MIKSALKKLKKILLPPPAKFDATGERVDILFNKKIDFETLDMFQKSHYKRYEHALEIIGPGEVCGDFACGTGYGAVMLSKKTKKVIGADINTGVVSAIQKRYQAIKNVEFIHANLLDLTYEEIFDNIISFETIEHFTEDNISRLLAVYNKGLKTGGKLIISTPYLQEKDEAALKLGHHLTFYINEQTIGNWLSAAGFTPVNFWYQNYDSHLIKAELDKKDFIICEAQKCKKIAP